MEAADFVAQFSRACAISTFLAAQENVCDARKLPWPLTTLAAFKYLLPDEIRLEREDTPADVVFGATPDQVLVFAFGDKNVRKRNAEQIRKVIRGRVARFERAVNHFVARRGSLDAIWDLSKDLVPPEPEQVKELSDSSDDDTPTDLSKDPSREASDPPATSIPKGRASFDLLTAKLENVLCVTTEPKREGSVKACPPHLVEHTGRAELWSHQHAALSYLEADSDHHLVVSTATASGKSLIFHSLVRKMLADGDGTAMFVYPTKALAQDQLRAFDSDVAFTFDGDTPWETRQLVKQRARILLVNPDILHATLLPRWQDWQAFLGNLRYVALDELHYYGGIFGAHVSCVVRRLRRLCSQLGADPLQFIGCSATLSDPKELMATITGLSPQQIMTVLPEDDGSPSGAKKFVFCTPDYLTPQDKTTGKKHPIQVSAPLFVDMVRGGMQVIAFCRYRRECELMLRAVYERDPGLKPLVCAYRGGYAPEDRRAIEARMFRGELRGIVATSALEVGIDVGQLDAAIISGFPHSIASFRQQVGRVGRRQRDALVVYVADGSVLDQTYARDPEKVLHAPVQRCPIVLHDSIVRSHLQAAAYELALDPADFAFFPRCANLEAAKLVKLRGDDDDNDEDDNDEANDDNNEVSAKQEPGTEKEEAGAEQDESDSDDDPFAEPVGNVVDYSDVTYAYPHKPTINLRRGEEEREDTVVIDAATNKAIERVEFDRVGFTLYDGAIFVHQGRSYLVEHLDANLRFAKVRRTHVKWVTRQRDYTDVDPLRADEMRTMPGPQAPSFACGQIRVTTKVFGYFKVDERNQIIDEADVEIPELVSVKAGVYLNLTVAILDTLRARQHHVAASIHAAEHVLMAVMPLRVSMAPGDVSTECKAPTKELYKRTPSQRRRPARLIFYERHGGELGNGILRAAFAEFPQLLEAACSSLDACECELGCAGCIGAGFCVEQNAVLSKSGARVILRMVLQRVLDGIPLGPDPGLDTFELETVVPVEAHTS